MQYTKYFSFIVKENGQPQMSSESFRTMMNVIYLEGVINGLNKSKEAHKGTDAYYKYDVSIFREEKRLTDITGNLDPDDLLKRMLSYS
jgi:hypothetical protein